MESIKTVRDNIDFDQDELSHIIYQGKEEFETHKHLVKTFVSDPVMHQNYNFYNLSREQTITLGYKRQARLEELGKQGVIEKPHMGTIGTYADLTSAPSALGLHYAMFEWAIRYLASDEQQADLIPKTMNCEINGCYAQTEIGHGSDVSSLETTATFDKATDSFVVNSPTIKSAKFWPGELGKTATHAAFHAQLIIFGKNYGVQTFLCQIRDMDSHSPLKGLEIGDIGNKGGYVQKDNGYMYFHDFIIPRSTLLARYTKVDRDGVFSVEGNPKFAYACMMYIRVYLIATASKYTAVCLNVALKYGLIRTQFKSLSDGNQERRISDYHSYRAKMAPIVAFTFASLFTKNRIVGIYFNMIKNINEKNDFTLLKEMHLLGSWLKAHFTQAVLDNMKTIRECWGAHGYSDYAGITNIIDIAAPNVTLEGDNHVMYQQTARGLLKSVAKIMQGKQLEGSFSYINELMNFEGSKLSKFDPDNLEHLESILKAHALFHIGRTGKALQMDREGSYDEKWNKKYLNDAIKMSNAHAVYMTADSFLTALKTLKLSEGLKKHMTTLCKIHLCHSILTYADGALLSGFVKAKHLFIIQEYMYEKIDVIAPQLLNLVEAFHYPEGAINTFVEPESGDVYNHLYQAASLNPINRTTKFEAFDKYVVPLSKRMSAGI